jgi:hypothetical protein
VNGSLFKAEDTMKRPVRQNPSLFPDTPAGILEKAKTMTRMCPDKESWRCAMGFVEYKLAPDSDGIMEEVLDEYIGWISHCRKQLEETGRCNEDLEGATADQLGELIGLVVAHLRSLEPE